MTTPPLTTAKAPDHLRFRPNLIVLALFVANFVEGILISGNSTVAPAVGKLLSANAGELNLSTVVHLVSGAVLVPVLARLGDIYGHRRLLRIAVAITILGTLLCALAPNYAVYLTGRALEGGITAFTALAAGILRDHLRPAKANRALAIVISGLMIGGLVGQLITSAVFHSTENVRSVLLVPFVFFAIALAMLFVFVPETRTRALVKVDWIGTATFAVGMSMLMTVIAKLNKWGWTSVQTVVIAAGAVAILTAWVVIELRVEQPFIDLRVAVQRATGKYILAAFAFGWAIWGTQTAFATFLGTDPQHGYGFGYSVTQIALISALGAAGAATGGLIVSKGTSKESYAIATYLGLAAMVVGYISMIIFSHSITALIVADVIVMVGVGVVSTAIPVVVSATAPPTSTGIVTALFNSSKGVAGAVSGAVFAVILTSLVIGDSEIPTRGGYVAVWLSCSAAALFAILVLSLARTRRNSTPSAPPMAVPYEP
ncbi:MFS transporter [Rhodococcus koreensis]